MKFFCVLLLFFSISVSLNGQYLSNPSFEDSPSTFSFPQGWQDPCIYANSPDVHGVGGYHDLEMYFNAAIEQSPSHGQTYILLKLRGKEYEGDEEQPMGTREALVTALNKKFTPGYLYDIAVDLCMEEHTVYGKGTGFSTPAVLQIFLGNGRCSPDTMIYQSVPSDHTQWLNYEFRIDVNREFSYLFLMPQFADSIASGIILIDHMRISAEDKCKDVKKEEIVLDTIVSKGASITLTADKGKAYQWSSDVNLSCTNCRKPTLTVNDTTFAEVTIMDNTGCSYKQKFILKPFNCEYAYPENPLNILNEKIDYESEIKLIAPDSAINPYWLINGEIFSENNDLVYLPQKPVQITLGYYDQYNCLIFMEFNYTINLIIPNVYTPNGDDKNQHWEILGLPDRNSLVIFNRFGSKVYETINYNNNWDGPDLPNGNYYYQLVLTDTEEVYTGWVYRLR